jgi:hypothetical protein
VTVSPAHRGNQTFWAEVSGQKWQFHRPTGETATVTDARTQDEFSEVDSGHEIHVDNPAAVQAAIDDVLSR